jgi:hypothetical protein
MWQKIKLYIISLFLLFLLLFLNKVPYSFSGDSEFIGFKAFFTKENLVVTISIIFMLLAAIFYFLFNFQIAEAATNLPVQITKIENYNFETVTFLATYIIPLVCFDLDFDLDKNRNLFMLFCVLFLIGLIYIKTNMFYTNPTLAVLGFHIYKINTIKQEGIIVIIKGKVKRDDWLFCKHISDNIFYAKIQK